MPKKKTQSWNIEIRKSLVRWRRLAITPSGIARGTVPLGVATERGLGLSFGTVKASSCPSLKYWNQKSTDSANLPEFSCCCCQTARSTCCSGNGGSSSPLQTASKLLMSTLMDMPSVAMCGNPRTRTALVVSRTHISFALSTGARSFTMSSGKGVFDMLATSAQAASSESVSSSCSHLLPSPMPLGSGGGAMRWVSSTGSNVLRRISCLAVNFRKASFSIETKLLLAPTATALSATSSSTAITSLNALLPTSASMWEHSMWIWANVSGCMTSKNSAFRGSAVAFFCTATMEWATGTGEIADTGLALYRMLSSTARGTSTRSTTFVSFTNFVSNCTRMPGPTPRICARNRNAVQGARDKTSRVPCLSATAAAEPSS
mmetsp:Transcript_31977/g.101635  ORF Transcript_31977/g.101635 Transcript_31977/m.101635 type:complete len:375 (+) Transcript_31977:995-2119(+)